VWRVTRVWWHAIRVGLRAPLECAVASVTPPPAMILLLTHACSGRIVSLELWRPLQQVTVMHTHVAAGVSRDFSPQVAAAPCFKDEGFVVESLHTREVEGVQQALVAGELGCDARVCMRVLLLHVLRALCSPCLSCGVLS